MMGLIPFRLAVLQELTAVLEEAQYDNGSGPENQTFLPMTGRVFRGRLLYGSTDPLPMISILEPPMPQEGLMSPNAGQSSVSKWELLIQGFVKDDIENPSDPAYWLMSSVRQKLIEARTAGNGYEMLGFGVKGRFRQPNNSIGYSNLGHNTIDQLIIGQGVVRPSEDITGLGFFWLSLTISIAENLQNPFITLET